CAAGRRSLAAGGRPRVRAQSSTAPEESSLVRRSARALAGLMLLAACRSPPAATPGASASPTEALPATFSSPANQAPAQRQEIQMPAAVEETAAAAAQGNLYVMGGFNAGGARHDPVDEGAG